MQWEKLIDGLVRERPIGALMRIDEAAKELGLEVADLLEHAEERERHSAALRVCVMMPIDWPVEPWREPMPSLKGLSLAESRFAFVDTPNTPGFFLELAARGVAVPNIGDFLSMVDGSGFVWAYDVEIYLEGLRVPREDVERLTGMDVAKQLEPDPVELWLGERCERSGWTDATTLLADFAEWTQANGFKLLSSREFGKHMIYAIGRDNKRKNSRSEYGVTLRIK